jgi:hypothetical protein
MTTEAAIGLGTTFQLHNGGTPGALEEIAEVFDITPPNEQSETIDVTHFGSTAREFIFGLTDFGECSFEMNLVPGSDSETAILAAKTGQTARQCVITFPNGWTWTYDGLVIGYEPAVPVDDKMTATVTIKVSGSVVREAGA